jgi:hypothetical protein
MHDRRGKHGACLVNAVAGVQQPLDALIVFRPQLDLKEVALVRSKTGPLIGDFDEDKERGGIGWMTSGTASKSRRYQKQRDRPGGRSLQLSMVA